MLFTGTLLVFALLHLLLFVFYPRARVNLHYAIFSAIVAGNVFFGFQEILSPSSNIYVIQIVVLAAPALGLIFGLRVLYSLFYAKLPKQFWVLFAGLSICGIMTTLTIGNKLPDWVPQSAIAVFALVGVLPFLVEMIRVIIVAVVKKKEGAWVVGIGFIILILTSIYAIKIDRFPNDFVFLSGVFGLLVSMSIHLARNVATTNKNLEVQLVQVQELSEKALEQERALVQEMEKELQTAHDMQMGLMPTGSPQIEGFDIAGRCIPANHVGGDFFQYFHLEGKLSITMADVTGHAMEAAVPVMVFSGVLDSQIEIGGGLEDLFGRLNRSLYRNLDRQTFVCFTMAELDPPTCIFSLCDAGCPYPYHFLGETGEIIELQVDTYPLGVRPETDYEMLQTQLQPGDRVVFCSDGIVEADNAAGEQFGYERTAETIRQACEENLSADAIIDRILEAVDEFKGDAPQSDDMTCVVVRVEDAEKSTRA